MRFWKEVIGYCIVTAGLLAGASPAHAIPGDYAILRSFPAPVESPDGIFWDGKNVWTTECTTADFYKLDPLDGTVLAKYAIPGAMIDHYEWDGTYLWGNDHHDGSVIRKMDLESLEVVENIQIPWDNVMGVAFDGRHLWTTNPSTNQLFKVDPDTGEIAGVLDFDFPGYQLAEQTCGIGWDGVCLWVGDIVSRKYHQVDPATGEVVLTIVAPGGEESMPTGFAWDGAHMWVVDENPNNPTIFLIDVEMLTSGPCAHGAREGEECGGPASTNCVDGYACVGVGSQGVPGICRSTCERHLAPCEEGFTCWQLDFEQAACLADPAGGPTGAIGDSCQGKADCQSHVCIDHDEAYICTEICEVGGDLPCPEGYECALTNQAQHACLPKLVVESGEPEGEEMDVASTDLGSENDAGEGPLQSSENANGCAVSNLSPHQGPKPGRAVATIILLLLASGLCLLIGRKRED